MQITIVGAVLQLLLLQTECTSWQPKLHGVLMKDFVSSRNLPIVSPSGTSGFSSSKPNLSDDVARGGHASVKVSSSTAPTKTTATTGNTSTMNSEHLLPADSPPPRPQTETANLNVDTVARSSSASSPATIGVSVLSGEMNNIIVDLPMEQVKGKKTKDTSSAAKIARKLKNRNNTNVRRKVMHAAFGLFFAVINYVVPKKTLVPIMLATSAFTLLVELLRYRKGFHWINEMIFHVVGKGLRKHEMEGKFTGTLYFLMGVTLTSMLYSKPCAALAICQLALADPAASYFGTKTKHVYWSRIENGLGGFGRNKGILGFLGGALFCVPFNYRILSCAKFASPPPARATLALASLAFGLAGAFADLAVPTPALTLPKTIMGRHVPPFHVDDNFVVPVFSGFACTQVFKALGWDLNLELAKCLLF